jgi:histidyl-tRNA synthetase
LNEIGLIKTDSENLPIDYCILPFGADEYDFALKVAKELQKEGNVVDIDYNETKLGKRLDRASKIAKFAIVIGDSEASSREVEIKNLETGEKTKRQF